MIVWLIEHTPLWVAALVVAIVLAATWRVWLAIFLVLPRWAQVALGAIAMGLLAFLAGRNRGSQSERDIQKQREAQAETTRKEVDHEIATLPPRARDQRLDRWMRE